MLLIIPLPFLQKLQIPRKQRIILVSVFACGVFTTAVSIVRLRALYQNLNGPYQEQSVTSVPIALWSVVEINVAIICGSVPSLKAFVSRVIFATKPGSTPSHGAYGLSASRKQSHVLRSQVDEDERRGSRLEIQVEQSIEMKAYHVDETGSDKDLIQAGAQGFRNDARNNTETKINAIGNTVSVSGSSSPV
ncbi:putative pth11-like integral membrane protein [Diaporthe ampelina]|uniref:Putative pth11-like integral membrane protein n=1 Tax=Diaporthe ampelina TaxID=1214573 RepID=A0A0G2HP86_9PEZI|nr:putative pth11-like integral membrane protein [Diaporthe ampelina]